MDREFIYIEMGIPFPPEKKPKGEEEAQSRRRRRRSPKQKKTNYHLLTTNEEPAWPKTFAVDATRPVEGKNVATFKIMIANLLPSTYLPNN